MNERTYEDGLSTRMLDVLDGLPIPRGPGGLVPRPVVAGRSEAVTVFAVVAIAAAIVLVATPGARAVLEDVGRALRGGAPKPAPAVESTPAPKPGSAVPGPFGPAILDRVVLTSNDVSATLRVRSDLAATGHLALGRLSSGLEGAALVSDPDFVDAKAQPFEGGDPYVFFGSWSALYTDPASAHDAFEGFVRMFGSPDWFPVTPQDPALGDEGVVFHVRQGQSGNQAALTGGREPRTMYIWRAGNLLMRIDAQGSFDPSEARRLAETMQSRAK